MSENNRNATLRHSCLSFLQFQLPFISVFTPFLGIFLKFTWGFPWFSSSWFFRDFACAESCLCSMGRSVKTCCLYLLQQHRLTCLPEFLLLFITERKGFREHFILSFLSPTWQVPMWLCSFFSPIRNRSTRRKTVQEL